MSDPSRRYLTADLGVAGAIELAVRDIGAENGYCLAAVQHLCSEPSEQVDARLQEWFHAHEVLDELSLAGELNHILAARDRHRDAGYLVDNLGPLRDLLATRDAGGAPRLRDGLVFASMCAFTGWAQLTAIDPLPLLADLLAARTSLVRVGAVLSAGDSRDLNALGLLVAPLTAGRGSVTVCAVEAVRRLHRACGPVESEFAEPVAAALSGILGSRNEELRISAAAALYEMGRENVVAAHRYFMKEHGHVDVSTLFGSPKKMWLGENLV